ncbi:hypothetical protein B5180_23625 [Streptomyces sp. BF-3]|uniref:hypothetical protein n=1 Tax=Streptomyces TaxID=1883 RepID=UPI00081D7457|nr:hypothetical protein B5180_23625 [Streptomyces sp. BF-3]SCF60282.1 hypothetical protein GA0115280_1029125 [Streptomyces sp. Cmuel-A718b]
MSHLSSFSAQLFSLADYGWDEACEHVFTPHRRAGLIPSRIVRAERGLLALAWESGARPVLVLTGDCRFTDCAHGREPGCAVMAAIEAGEIPQRRLDSYQRLLRENAYAASRTDARLRTGREAVRKGIAQNLRATYRFRERQS